MLKSALLEIGLVAGVATTASAQTYYPYYYPGYSNPTYSYPYGYSVYYGWPYSGYYPAPAPSYQRTPPSYADPYVYARPYSDGAGPAPN